MMYQVRKATIGAGMILALLILALAMIAFAGCSTAKTAAQQLDGYTVGFEKADTVCTLFLANESGAVILQRLPDSWCALIPVQGKFQFKLNTNAWLDSTRTPPHNPGPGP